MSQMDEADRGVLPARRSPRPATCSATRTSARPQPTCNRRRRRSGGPSSARKRTSGSWPTPADANRTDQVLSVLRFLPDELKPMIRLAYVTGWRIRAEIAPLQWSQVELDARTLRLEPVTTKNGDGRLFVMTPELHGLLVQQWQVHRALRAQGRIVPWVFHRDGEPIKTFRTAWKTATAAAGCPGRIPHDFRRTAVRNLVRAGVPERVAMRMTGHKTRSVFDRYHIVSQADHYEAALKLAAVTDAVIAADQHCPTRDNCGQRRNRLSRPKPEPNRYVRSRPSSDEAT